MSENNKKKTISPVSIDPDLIGHKFYDFTVPGDPFGKQRPRAARVGNHLTIYTPKETKKYEKEVVRSFKNQYINQYINSKPFTGPVTVKIEGIFAPPSSASKRGRELMLEGTIPHVKKPDCDNMAKSCLDALNGVAYIDDAVIDKLVVTKRYGEVPMARILIIDNKDNNN